MISTPDRRRAVGLIDEAVEAGASREKACHELGVSLRTWQRWTQGGGELRSDGRPQALLQARWRLTMPAAIGISLIFATILGGAIEWIQPLVGRTESLLDFGLNELGVVLGAGLVAAYQISGQPARCR